MSYVHFGFSCPCNIVVCTVHTTFFDIVHTTILHWHGDIILLYYVRWSSRINPMWFWKLPLSDASLSVSNSFCIHWVFLLSFFLCWTKSLMVMGFVVNIGYHCFSNQICWYPTSYSFSLIIITSHYDHQKLCRQCTLVHSAFWAMTKLMHGIYCILRNRWNSQITTC